MRQIEALPGRVLVRLDPLPEKLTEHLIRPASATMQVDGEAIQRIGTVIAVGAPPIAPKAFSEELIIVGSSQGTAADFGRAMANGPQANRLPMPVSIGDRVAFRSYAACVDFDGETLYSLRVYPRAENQILGVVINRCPFCVDVRIKADCDKCPACGASDHHAHPLPPQTDTARAAQVRLASAAGHLAYRGDKKADAMEWSPMSHWSPDFRPSNSADVPLRPWVQ